MYNPNKRYSNLELMMGVKYEICLINRDISYCRCTNGLQPIQASHNFADISNISADAIQGIHCDFCHKITGVILDPDSGLPPENMTGVLSIKLQRPYNDAQIFFGPFDDVDVGPDTFSPLQNESKCCPPCHNASFWGTPVYESYKEWLESSYPEEGQTCQSCHT